MEPTESATDSASPIEIDPDADPRLWLEEVEGEPALAWARGENQRSYARLRDDPRYAKRFEAALQLYQSEDRIPYGRLREGQVYNFWEDASRRHGLWRRASLSSYLDGEPQWESLLDLDALAAAEDRNWVWQGANCAPDGSSRCLLTLSDGGTDAAVRREFDVTDQGFVDGGFTTPDAKGNVAWVHEDELLVLLAVDPAETTTSGYPFVARRWQRGSPLQQAREVLRGEPEDVGLWAFRLEGNDGEAHVIVNQSHTFYESTSWLIPPEGEPVALPLPRQASIEGLYRGQLIFTTNESFAAGGSSDHAPGTVLSFDLQRYLDTRELPPLHTVFLPGERQAVRSIGVTASAVLLVVDDNVIGSLRIMEFDEDWQGRDVALPDNLSLTLVDSNVRESVAFLSAEGFLQPATLYAVDAANANANANATPIRSAPAWFDSDGLIVEQSQVESPDGTAIPYFLVRREDMAFDGDTPTLLYAYGGFQVGMAPNYSGIRGRLWLEQGGAYVLANIRGGGEFGPSWHQAGLKTKRQVIYDDLIAVAEDLIDRKVTRPVRLAVDGRSNGGLLTGVMYTQRPELWGAVISGVPLLDMLRYHHLLAGASWMGEYGDPDDEVEGAFLRQISPYHNVSRDGVYPEIFLYTSTKDDRVHPGHARKFAHLLSEAGHPYLYYENIEGGHAGAANLEETAHRDTMLFQFLVQRLMDPQ
ncbi:MAG: S9 family peptidase [Gammaproteobacteria bacterium]|nr:S9 family peptidase [Gammaproteobacteria bacterium]